MGACLLPWGAAAVPASQGWICCPPSLPRLPLPCPYRFFLVGQSTAVYCSDVDRPSLRNVCTDTVGTFLVGTSLPQRGCLTVFCGRQENNQRQTDVLRHRQQSGTDYSKWSSVSSSRLGPFCRALACSCLCSGLPCPAMPGQPNATKATLWPTLACIRIHTIHLSTARPSFGSTGPRPLAHISHPLSGPRPKDGCVLCDSSDRAQR